MVSYGNSHGKSERALRIDLHGFKFHDSNLVQEHGTAQMTIQACNLAVVVVIHTKIDGSTIVLMLIV